MNLWVYADGVPMQVIDPYGLTSYRIKYHLLAGGEGIGAGIGYAEICELACTDGSRKCALYWFWGIGGTIAPMPIGKISSEFSYHDDNPSSTPPDFKSFEGSTAFGGITVVGGYGFSGGRMKFGDHDMNATGSALGLDGSLDAMFGRSHQIHDSWDENCCDF